MIDKIFVEVTQACPYFLSASFHSLHLDSPWFIHQLFCVCPSYVLCERKEILQII